VGYDRVQQRRLPEAARRFGLGIAYANACGQEGKTAYNGWSTLVASDGHRVGLAGRESTRLHASLPLRTAPD